MLSFRIVLGWLLSGSLVLNAVFDVAQGEYVGISYDLGAARQAGNLCDESVSLSATPNQLLVRWGASRLTLDSVGSDVARGRCLLRIPATVPVGYTIAALTARAQSKANKPAGVEAVIHLAVVASAAEPLVVERVLPKDVSWSGAANAYGAFDGLEPLVSDWRTMLCSPTRSEDLVLGINLGVALQRSWGAGEASIDLSGPQQGLDVWVELLPCT
jgi:hypothetical protein